MPEPIEKGAIFACLKVVKRLPHSQYEVRCWKCKTVTVMAASSLRKKKINCRRCFPTLRHKANPEVIYSKRGYAYTEEAA